MLAECLESKPEKQEPGTKRGTEMPNGKASTGNEDRVGKKVDRQAEYNCCVLAKGGGASGPSTYRPGRRYGLLWAMTALIPHHLLRPSPFLASHPLLLASRLPP